MKTFLWVIAIQSISGFAMAGVISAQYDHDRFYVSVPFKGVTASLLLDSGGNTGIYSEYAWYWKTKESAVKEGKLWFGKESPFSSFLPDTLQQNHIRILSQDDEELRMIRKLLKDGMLGHSWLGTRIWNFNYPLKKLTVLPKAERPKGKAVELNFKGEGFYYPRMQIHVDGEALDVLFDTGGSSFFAEHAMKELGLKQAFAASSFIRESIFEAWRTKHPEWKVISAGDRMGNNDLIRVPKVTIAGQAVGPVWFAKRPNQAYDEFMSQYMDCKCAGAIGGNVLKYFEITINYPAKKAWFSRRIL